MTASGDVALVEHALTPVETVADVYTNFGGGWDRTSEIGLGLSDGAGSTPVPAHLTGATDFLVRLALRVANLSVISNVGGRWALVPFKGGPAYNGQTQVGYPTVHGNEITSGVKDCRPACSSGRITYTTWSYDRAARAFEPIKPARPPSRAEKEASSLAATWNSRCPGCAAGPLNTFQVAEEIGGFSIGRYYYKLLLKTGGALDSHPVSAAAFFRELDAHGVAFFVGASRFFFPRPLLPDNDDALLLGKLAGRSAAAHCRPPERHAVDPAGDVADMERGESDRLH